MEGWLPFSSCVLPLFGGIPPAARVGPPIRRGELLSVRHPQATRQRAGGQGSAATLTPARRVAWGCRTERTRLKRRAVHHARAGPGEAPCCRKGTNAVVVREA